MNRALSYQDVYKRWHNKSMNDGEYYPCNNAWIYSAECASVGLPINYKRLRDCLLNSRTKYGVTRHPKKGSAVDRDKKIPPVSHDELLGIAYFFGNKELVAHLEASFWQFCDLKSFKPKSLFLLNWFKVIKAYIAIYKRVKAGENPRHITLEYPEVYPLAFRMPFWVRYLVKAHSNVQPTLVESLMFFISKMVTIYISKSNSSLRLLGFQLIKTRTISPLTELLYTLFNRKHDILEITKTEYPSDHPIFDHMKDI
jgi:hypothetical protein